MIGQFFINLLMSLSSSVHPREGHITNVIQIILTFLRLFVPFLATMELVFLAIAGIFNSSVMRILFHFFREVIFLRSMLIFR